MVRALEAIGAAVESERPGEAFFALDGLRGIHGGDGAGVLAAARRALGRGARRIGTGADPLRRLRSPPAEWRAAGSRSRLLRLRGSRPRGARPRSWSRPSSGSGSRPCRRFARLSADQVADRFGPLGLRALRLCPRRGRAAAAAHAARGAGEEIELPEGTAGSQLERALELLVDRLLAAPQRQGTDPARPAPRGAARGRRQLERRAGPGPAERLGPGPALASWRRGCEALPGPATALRLRALGLGPPAARPARARGRRRGAAPAPPRRRGARGPRRAGRGGAAEDPAGRLRLAGARALGDADPLPGALMPGLRRLYAPRAGGGPDRSAAAPRSRSTGSRSRPSARSGWSRTAGGRRSRCAATTSSWRWATAAPSPSSAPLVPSAGTGSGPEAVYVELHAHSAFSFLDGASTPTELAAPRRRMAIRPLPYRSRRSLGVDGVCSRLQGLRDPSDYGSGVDGGGWAGGSCRRGGPTAHLRGGGGPP